MSNRSFHPGEEYRVARGNERGARENAIVQYDEHGTVLEVWLKNKPVPSLPNEPHTKIRVIWRFPEDEEHLPRDFGLNEHGVWESIPGTYAQWPNALSARISGYEVLAVPIESRFK